ncbi:UbiX family flavin prenyltransferase [methane-oxidizing endosymbiont of Gigantopelta aegis]|uniref:UbiX family flavin prenyltransferase n=1 Tax=methane-oxidizing endosymbiont of Gigantopelta aegis TaxID=2794938 RepID=UPI00247AC719|nr:UbiX family flavin prenyltransferase [methane-oxidizing endosymbiont of Gigantopelta aegis]
METRLKPRKKRLIIALTGATGAIYGIRMLQVLQTLDEWESHLIISSAGLVNLKFELNMRKSDIESLADQVHGINDIAAAVSSGSFKTEGMIIAPCSMKTLAAIAHGFGDNLITRAADVQLKERRKVVLMPRETPLNLAHVRNMVTATEMGAILYPPMPAFYNKSDSVMDMVNEAVGRILEMFGIEANLHQEWTGL